MARYSILIPAYQAEKTIARCVDSVLKQQGDFEVIIIDDGSTDQTKEVLKPYLSKVQYLKNRNNQGVAAVRNALIKQAQGTYLMFVDADDYIKEGLLEEFDRVLDVNPEVDVVSFGIDLVSSSGACLATYHKPSFSCVSGEEAFCTFVENGATFDTPVGYLYRKSYIEKHSFAYATGHHHEDFGLTPLILLYAERIVSLDEAFYCYVQTNESITRTVNQDKVKQNARDMLYHFDHLKKTIDIDSSIGKKAKEYFYSFLANSLIQRASQLPKEFSKEYKEALKVRKVTSMLLDDTWKRKLKKWILSLYY